MHIIFQYAVQTFIAMYLEWKTYLYCPFSPAKMAATEELESVDVKKVVTWQHYNISATRKETKQNQKPNFNAPPLYS